MAEAGSVDNRDALKPGQWDQGGAGEIESAPLDCWGGPEQTGLRWQNLCRSLTGHPCQNWEAGDER